MRCVAFVPALVLGLASVPALAVTGVPAGAAPQPAATIGADLAGLGQAPGVVRPAGAARCWGCTEAISSAPLPPPAAAAPGGWERLKRGISGLAQRLGGLFGA